MLRSLPYWFILLAAFWSMVLGGLWYGPFFGKIWMQLSGFKKSQKPSSSVLFRSYSLMFLGSLITAFVLAYFFTFFPILSWSSALLYSFYIWFGFFAPVMLGSFLWENKPFTLYLINVGYWFVALLGMGLLFCLMVVKFY